MRRVLASSTQLVVEGRIARRILEEAGRPGITPEEYLVELLSQNLDPKSKAVEYVEAARISSKRPEKN